MLPQIILLLLFAMKLGYDIVRHGEQKTVKYNGTNSFIVLLVWLFLLYWGGFFDIFFI